MRPLQHPLLADENIHPEVVRALESGGRDILSCRAARLSGKSDAEVLRKASLLGRVVITHDLGFGSLAIQAGEPVFGIIVLRPGHIDPGFVIEILEAVDRTVRRAKVPFIIVAERRGNTLRVRYRELT